MMNWVCKKRKEIHDKLEVNTIIKVVHTDYFYLHQHSHNVLSPGAILFCYSKSLMFRSYENPGKNQNLGGTHMSVVPSTLSARGARMSIIFLCVPSSAGRRHTGNWPPRSAHARAALSPGWDPSQFPISTPLPPRSDHAVPRHFPPLTTPERRPPFPPLCASAGATAPSFLHHPSAVHHFLLSQPILSLIRVQEADRCSRRVEPPPELEPTSTLLAGWCHPPPRKV
jgi:hypothetical protein